jgi:hypothetical protein
MASILCMCSYMSSQKAAVLHAVVHKVCECSWCNFTSSTADASHILDKFVYNLNQDLYCLTLKKGELPEI